MALTRHVYTHRQKVSSFGVAFANNKDFSIKNYRVCFIILSSLCIHGQIPELDESNTTLKLDLFYFRSASPAAIKITATSTFPPTPATPSSTTKSPRCECWPRTYSAKEKRPSQPPSRTLTVLSPVTPVHS